MEADVELEELLVSIQVAAEGVDETVNAITRAQEKAYKAILSVVEHRKKLNSLSLSDEIAALERIKAEYAHTAQQVMEIDERIYAAREKLRAQEETQLTRLHEAVIDALSARYEEQRQAEQRRIDESGAAWTRWSQETCAAIQAQLDALDEKEKAEDRAAISEEKLRAIDRIRQQMTYETDAYNLRQLEKQLREAESDWAQTQADWARTDERGALSAQMDAVRTQADAQLEALRKESEQLDALYQQLTQSARLSQEARETMLGAGTEGLSALLSRYAADFSLAGESFGERFYAGFQKALGDLSGWLDVLGSAMDAQLSAASAPAAGGSGGALSGAAVTQNVHFHVPVESPADAARRMEEVNLALVQML